MKKEDSISIEYFFSNFKLELSEYQRPYLWSGEQIINLFNDLKAFSWNNNNAPDFYLGNIILVKKNKKFQIIDGQQRIISLLIISTVLKNSLYPKDFRISSKESIENVKKNAGYLKNHIVQLDLEIKIEWSKINITYIIAENDDQAFKFYTTLSTSGKRLAGIDIIKPFHLQAIPKNEQEDKAIELEKYQFDNNKLEIITQILLRCRYWNGVNNKAFPRINHLDEWKNTLELEFITKCENNLSDFKYTNSYQKEQQIHISEPKYFTNQPLSKGNNTINYLLYFAGLWDQINKIITQLKLKSILKVNELKGTTFNNEYFQAVLITYIAKFGEEIIYHKDFEKVIKLIFKVCFYTRLDMPVKKDTVFDFEKENKLINRILISYSEEEVLQFFKNYSNWQILGSYKDYKKNNFKGKPTIMNFQNAFQVNEDNVSNPFFN